MISNTSMSMIILLANVMILKSYLGSAFSPNRITNISLKKNNDVHSVLLFQSTSSETEKDFLIQDDESSSSPSSSSSSSSLSSSSAKLRSLKFTQLTKATNPGLLSDYLMELGASSVSITDHDRDTPSENPIFAEPSEENADIFAAIICGDAAVGKNLWMRCDVTAHFADSFDITGIVDDVRTNLEVAAGVRYEVDDVPDLDWIREVQSSWKPFLVGDFILKFPWHIEKDVQEVLQAESANDGKDEDFQPHEILLQGGIAFGTGEHPTTQLCLNWIKETVQNEEGIELFLDYGAGSGVLGIAACILDKKIQSVGVEIDADAVRIADENAESNNADMKSYLPRNIGSDDESASLIMKAMQRSSADILPENLDDQIYDACAANILAGPLITLAKTIADMVKPGGFIGLSGILEWQSDDVVEAYSEYFDNVQVKETSRGWVLISGQRKCDQKDDD